MQFGYASITFFFQILYNEASVFEVLGVDAVVEVIGVVQTSMNKDLVNLILVQRTCTL